MATTAIGNDATDLASILQAAMAGSYVAHGSGQTFTVSQSIVIYVNSTTQGPLGLDLGGGTIISNITDGSPVIKVVVGPNVDLRYLTFSNFTIQGNGREGSGIQVVAGANERWVYNFGVDNVTVKGVGGYGIDVQGSVFEGIISNSWMSNNAKGGAYFGHLADGQASALRWYGGGFENNGGPGMTLDNGARDMVVDGVKFAGNQGGGISAESGITAVSNSEFIDNKGHGVWFQNYGNFDNNTFTTSGTQTVGVTGWLNGNATVVNSHSVWTGSGADPTMLANLNGYGSVFTSGDTGKIVTGSSLSVNTAGGGNLSQVSVGGQGVALPTLQAVSEATTAPLPNSNGTGAVETALKSAVATGNAELTESSYSVSAPIVINLTNANQGPINLDFGGAKIQSSVNGGPIIEIIVGPGVNLSQLTLSNLLINGNGRETAGIKIVADGADRSIQNLSINGVNIEHTGGIGLDVIGNVSGTIFNSWMNGNAGGGARFANGPNGGVADDLYWIGGGFRKNEVAGLILDNGTRDMTVKSAYFVENVGVGIYATSGITLVKGSGFENNGGTGAVVKGPSTFAEDTFSTWGAQKVAVGGYLSGGQVNLTAISNEYYGPGTDPTVVANLQGTGTLAIAGGGKVVVGSGISVTGGVASIPIGDPEVATDNPAPVPVPVVTEKLVSDTGSSASDGITKSAALTGTADPDATVKITIDGTQVGTTTADATGKWSYTPTGLSDGRHTVVASETNAGGQTGSATLTFTLDTSAPVVTQALVGGGTSTTTGALTGTAEAGAVIRFTVDGTQIAGTATADATGKWTYTPSGLAAGSHTVVATQTDAAGNTGSASLTFTMSGSGTGDTTPPPTGTTSLAFTGATWANGQMTVTGTTSGPGQTVWIYDSGSWAGAVTSDASSKFTFKAAAAAGSTHSFGAIALDASGNTVGKTTTPYVYTAGTSTPAPTVPTVTAALSADTGSSTTDKVTSNATLTGTADPNATIKFTVDGAAIAATATADATGKWTFTPTGLADGQHTIVASETNTAGTGSATLTFTLDRTVPTVTSKLAADTGASATDKITSNATISGTAAANSTVKFTIDGVAVAATATADASGNWSFTPAGLADGQHTIVASQTDIAGNTGSSSLTFTLATGGGSVTATLANDTGSSGTDKVTSSGAITGTAAPGAVIKLTVDGTPVATTVTANASGNWSFTPSGLADGQHTIVASQADLAGNTNSATLAFTLDRTAPVVTASSTAMLAVAASATATSPTIAGTADPNATVRFTVDGTALAATATTDASGRWSYTPTGLSAGDHTIVASQTDLAGNTGSASVVFTATDGGLGGGTPSTPTFTGGSYADGKLTVTGTTPTGNATVWIYDGSNWAGAVTSDASGRFSFTTSAAAGSVHSFGAIAIDPAGNTTKTTAPYAYTAVESGTSAPPTGELPLVTGKLVSDTGASATDGITANAALVGLADPNAVVHFTIDGTAIAATATADATGKWSYTPTGLSDGFHTVVASVTDAAGETGAATVAFTYNVHSPIPIFTGESLSNGKVTITGTTGTAGDQVSIYDGGRWAGFATTGADGTFSFTTKASDTVHTYGANATGPMGEGKGMGKALLGSTAADTLAGSSGNDVIVGNGGNDVITGGLGTDKLTGGAGSDTFAYTAAAHSTAAAADVITDFQHGVDKIDFTVITGINASNGTPTFQGYLTGTGSQTVNAHSVAVMEVGGNTAILVNTSDAAQTVSNADLHAVDMKITLTGVNLGLAASDFHHN